MSSAVLTPPMRCKLSADTTPTLAQGTRVGCGRFSIRRVARLRDGPEIHKMYEMFFPTAAVIHETLPLPTLLSKRQIKKEA